MRKNLESETELSSLTVSQLADELYETHECLKEGADQLNMEDSPDVVSDLIKDLIKSEYFYLRTLAKKPKEEKNNYLIDISMYLEKAKKQNASEEEIKMLEYKKKIVGSAL